MALATPENLARGFDIIKKYSTHPTDTTFLSQESTLFFHNSRQAMINTAKIGGGFVILGGIVGNKKDHESVLSGFLSYAKQNRQRVSVLMLLQSQLKLFGDAGFGIHQIGVSYVCNVNSFDLSGSKYSSIRNMIVSAKKSGIEIKFMPLREVDSETEEQLNNVDNEWRAVRKVNAPKVRFVVGDRYSCIKDRTMIVLALQNNKVVAYHTLQQTFGQTPGWMVDSTRRIPNDIKGLSEILVTETIDAMKNKRLSGSFYNFGNAPFDNISPEYSSGYERPIGNIVLKVMQKYPERFYSSAKGLANYKRKWRVECYPEYYGYYPHFSPKNTLEILKGIGALV